MPVVVRIALEAILILTLIIALVMAYRYERRHHHGLPSPDEELALFEERLKSRTKGATKWR